MEDDDRRPNSLLTATRVSSSSRSTYDVIVTVEENGTLFSSSQYLRSPSTSSTASSYTSSRAPAIASSLLVPASKYYDTRSRKSSSLDDLMGISSSVDTQTPCIVTCTYHHPLVQQVPLYSQQDPVVTDEIVRGLGLMPPTSIKGSVEMFSCALSQNGRLLAFTAHERDCIQVIGLKTGALQTLLCDVQPCGVAFAPNGRSIYVGHIGYIGIYDVSPLRLRRRFRKFTQRDAITSLCVSWCEKFIVSSSGNVANVTELATGKSFARLEGHSGAIFDIAILANNKTVVTSSRDGTVVFWHFHKRRFLLHVIADCASSTFTLALQPNSDIYAVVSKSRQEIKFFCGLDHRPMQQVIRLNDTGRKIVRFVWLSCEELVILTDTGELVRKLIADGQEELLSGKYDGAAIFCRYLTEEQYVCPLSKFGTPFSTPFTSPSMSVLSSVSNGPFAYQPRLETLHSNDCNDLDITVENSSVSSIPARTTGQISVPNKTSIVPIGGSRRARASTSPERYRRQENGFNAHQNISDTKATVTYTNKTLTSVQTTITIQPLANSESQAAHMTNHHDVPSEEILLSLPVHQIGLSSDSMTVDSFHHEANYAASDEALLSNEPILVNFSEPFSDYKALTKEAKSSTLTLPVQNYQGSPASMHTEIPLHPFSISGTSTTTDIREQKLILDFEDMSDEEIERIQQLIIQKKANKKQSSVNVMNFEAVVTDDQATALSTLLSQQGKIVNDNHVNDDNVITLPLVETESSHQEGSSDKVNITLDDVSISVIPVLSSTTTYVETSTALPSSEGPLFESLNDGHTTLPEAIDDVVNNDDVTIFNESESSSLHIINSMPVSSIMAENTVTAPSFPVAIDATSHRDIAAVGLANVNPRICSPITAITEQEYQQLLEHLQAQENT